MRLLLALILASSVNALHAAQFSADSAINLIEFCKEVNVESEARFKAELAEDLTNPDQCWAANKWSLSVHNELIASGYSLDLFIPSRYVERDQHQRLEIFVWYSDAKGRKMVFENSCELSEEAKKAILRNPQKSC